jgi:nucleotide-binding universal stress UspA family protein
VTNPSPQQEPRELEELRFRRLLVAIDTYDGSELILAAAVTAARHGNSRLTFISVAPRVAPTVAYGPIAATPEQLQHEADAERERTLRKVAARIPGDIPVTRIFRKGRPGPEIVAEAARRDYDAILIGSRGRGRVGALIGSVSQHVLHYAEIPVLVVHAPRPRPME